MKLLSLEKTLDILKKYNIGIPDYKVVKNEKDLVEFTKSNDFPLVLKVFSTNILHRTEKNLVVTDINSLDELKKEFLNIQAKLKEGEVLVQKQIKGVELIIGMKRDKSFGPAILFGVGGIFVEVLKDISWKIAPLDLSEAKRMINSIKSKKILNGYRNIEKVDIDKLADILVKVSKIAMNETHIKEIDFNPVIANKNPLPVDFKFLI